MIQQPQANFIMKRDSVDATLYLKLPMSMLARLRVVFIILSALPNHYGKAGKARDIP